MEPLGRKSRTDDREQVGGCAVGTKPSCRNELYLASERIA